MKITATHLISALMSVLISVLISISVNADVEHKSLSSPRTTDQKNLVICPELASIDIATLGKSLEAEAITIRMKKETVEMKATQPTRECISDMVCSTSDNFSISDAGYASVRRNNDGNYPTNDLPGHDTLTLTGRTLSNRMVTCYYDLK